MQCNLTLFIHYHRVVNKESEIYLFDITAMILRQSCL